MTPDKLPQIAIKVRGTVRLPPDALHPSGRTVVIQGATKANATAVDAAGRYIIIYDKPVQMTPLTIAQRLRRAILAEATAAYIMASAEAKAAARAQADARRITLCNAFVSDYLSSHDTRSFTPWDGGRSTWDGDDTRYDSSISRWDDDLSLWDDNATQYIT